MQRPVIFVLLAIMLLSVQPIGAQVAGSPAPNISYYDYFEAAQMGMQGAGGYLRVLESAHVVTIPKWLSNGQINNAVGDIKYTLDRFPNHPQSLQQLSMVAQLTKNDAWAVSYFERAIRLFPQYAITRAQYGLFLVAIGNFDGGIEKFNQAIEMDPKLPAGYAGLAHAYAKKGDMPKAREAAQKARELGFTGKLPDGL